MCLEVCETKIQASQGFSGASQARGLLNSLFSPPALLQPGASQGPPRVSQGPFRGFGGLGLPGGLPGRRQEPPFSRFLGAFQGGLPGPPRGLPGAPGAPEQKMRQRACQVQGPFRGLPGASQGASQGAFQGSFKAFRSLPRASQGPPIPGASQGPPRNLPGASQGPPRGLPGASQGASQGPLRLENAIFEQWPRLSPKKGLWSSNEGRSRHRPQRGPGGLQGGPQARLEKHLPRAKARF